MLVREAALLPFPQESEGNKGLLLAAFDTNLTGIGRGPCQIRMGGGFLGGAALYSIVLQAMMGRTISPQAQWLPIISQLSVGLQIWRTWPWPLAQALRNGVPGWLVSWATVSGHWA